MWNTLMLSFTNMVRRSQASDILWRYLSSFVLYTSSCCPGYCNLSQELLLWRLCACLAAHIGGFSLWEAASIRSIPRRGRRRCLETGCWRLFTTLWGKQTLMNMFSNSLDKYMFGRTKFFGIESPSLSRTQIFRLFFESIEEWRNLKQAFLCWI